jgi:hemoglobin
MKHTTLAVRLFALLMAPAFAGAAQAQTTLYEEIGGEAKLRSVAEEFTNVILADPRINFTFANTDLAKFKQLIFEQLCNITGGPCQYTGRSMKESHEKLNSTNAQFNALAEDLYIAFERTNVPYRLQNKVMALLAPMQKDIVKKGATGKPDLTPTPAAPASVTSPSKPPGD